ncbi:hypothetical protein AaE_005161 [Aphanomyces astaci]|uniref:NrS-1 polymerase-like helicase domain-containing protein n=1 Tax=Aphanomyces astaci TaxID=112090 RepID=A0A6A5AN77_APHAT|nr:hypothetical protein AaE_005161 [Aphanomyces astaci]
MCNAQTLKNTQCKLKNVAGSDFCRKHLPAVAPVATTIVEYIEVVEYESDNEYISDNDLESDVQLISNSQLENMQTDIVKVQSEEVSNMSPQIQEVQKQPIVTIQEDQLVVIKPVEQQVIAIRSDIPAIMDPHNPCEFSDWQALQNYGSDNDQKRLRDYIVNNFAHIACGGKSLFLTKNFNRNGQIEYQHMSPTDVARMIQTIPLYDGGIEPVMQHLGKAYDRRVFNTFSGFVHLFAEDFVVDNSKIERFLEHIRLIWAAGNQAVYEAIMKVFAMYVQRPDQKTQLCLVMLGREGVGKNIITDILKNFVIGGRYVLETADISKITQRFNGSVENKLLCVLDEAASVNGKDRHKDQEALKVLINSTELVVEKKGQEPYTIQDRCNYICFSNNDYVIKASTEMRRFVYCRVSGAKIGNAKYFRDMYEDFSKRGAGIHLYHCLMNLDVANFVPQRDFPMTEAKAEMQRDAIDKTIQWVVASINEEVETVNYDSLMDLTRTRNCCIGSTNGFASVMLLLLHGATSDSRNL